MRDVSLWLRAEWDRVLGLVCVLAGGVSLLLMWNGIRTSPFVADQLTYLASGGVGGLFLLATGVMLRLSADLHDEWHKLDAIEEAIRSNDGAAGHDATSSNGAVPANDVAGASPRTPAPRMGTASAARRRPAAVVGLALALVVMLVGWRQAASTADVEHAIDGAAVAVAGLILAGVAVCGSLVVLRWELAQRKLSLFAPLLGRPEAGQTSPDLDDTVIVVPSLSRFHLEGCPATSGLAGTRTRREVAEQSLEPCGICGLA